MQIILVALALRDQTPSTQTYRPQTLFYSSLYTTTWPTWLQKFQFFLFVFTQVMLLMRTVTFFFPTFG